MPEFKSGSEGSQSEEPQQESFEKWKERQGVDPQKPDTTKENLESVDPDFVYPEFTPEEIEGLWKMNKAMQDAKTTPEVLREPCEEMKVKLNELIANFEINHSLDYLNSITDISPEFEALTVATPDLIATQQFEELQTRVAKLSPEEAEKYRVRESAREEVNLIKTLLIDMERKTDISPEELKALKDGCKRSSRAFGVINRNKVDHTR